MRTYELVVIWDTGEKNVYSGYKDEATAKAGGYGMEMAFGKQISWWGVRPSKGV